MKIMYLRARRLETAISLYSLVRGSRPIHCVKKNSQSRVRRAGSGHQVFRRGTISSYQPYYVWKFGDFLCFVFFVVFVVLLLCNLNKIL